jgi:putative nucleotidyltransferase with HDIG domain
MNMLNSANKSCEFKLPTPKAVETALGELSKLPLMPYAAQQATALAAKKDADLVEFTRLLERDVTLAASILKLANSPIFSWGRNIDSIEQAVIRLGIRECRNLLVAASMANLYQQSAPSTKAYCAILWKHCFLTACFTRRLSQELKCDYSGEEFTAGLLHDLGRVLLGITMPDHVRQVDQLSFIEGDDLLEKERDALETDHCEFGMHYAQQNQLPLSVISAIGYHHRYHQAKEHHGILSLVITADHMANYVQRGDPLDKYDIAQNPGMPALAQKWSKERIAWFHDRVPTLIYEVTNQDSAASGSTKPSSPPKGSTRPGSGPTKPEKPAGDSGVWKRVSSWF